MSTYKKGTQREGDTAVTARCPMHSLAACFNPFDEDLAFYAQARQEAPVFYYPPLECWVVTCYEDVLAIELDAQTFKASNALELIKPFCEAALETLASYGVQFHSFFVEDGPLHFRHRQMLTKPLFPASVSFLEPFIRRVTKTSLDRLVKRGHADLIQDMLLDIPALVIFHLCGVPDEEHAQMRTFAKRLAVLSFGQPSDKEQVDIAHAIGQYWQFSKRHVNRLMESPGDDTISTFLAQMRKPENTESSDENFLYTLMVNLLFAGHETTTAALGGAVRALLENRSEWESICADPTLIPNAIEESLRFATPVPHWRRITTKATTISGVALPAGSCLLIALASANRDETRFAYGDAFDIRRPNARRHLSFGYGRHACLGMHLARLEMGIVLDELTRRLPHMQLVEGQPWTFSPTISMRGPEHLLVTWDLAQNPRAKDRPEERR